jgi:hypothetical protein
MTREDIDYVIKNIRDADRREVEDAQGVDIKEALQNLYHIKNNAWTGLVDGNIVAIFGVQRLSFITDFGVPWMLGAKNMDKYWITFARHCKPVFKLMSENFSELANYVDDRNDLAKLWLKYLGFQLSEPLAHGAKNLPYRKLFMRLNHV